MNWPMPSQIGSDGRGFLRTHQAARAPSIPLELADLNGHSLGNFVNALLGETPFPNDPDLPEMPDEWESSLEAFELDKAAVRSKVCFGIIRLGSKPLLAVSVIAVMTQSKARRIFHIILSIPGPYSIIEMLSISLLLRGVSRDHLSSTRTMYCMFHCV